MEDIFRYVACREENFSAFSIKIESTLIDVCAFLDSVCQDFIRLQQARHELPQKSSHEKPSSQDARTPFRNQVAGDKFDAKVSGVANFNMADYRTLLEPELRLSDCIVRLRAYEENYPSLGNPEGFSLAPFAPWKEGRKLPWWESFTKLKHDRISNFQLATLGNSIHALAAVFVVLSFKHKHAFHEGSVDREMYSFFLPLYWKNGGSIMPAIPRWKDG